MEMLSVILLLGCAVSMLWLYWRLLRDNEDLRDAVTTVMALCDQTEAAIIEQAYGFHRAYETGGDRDDLVRYAGVMELIYRLGLLDRYGAYVDRERGVVADDD